ncbi:MAG: metallophosphoesterase [Nanoarchaeota archaeon]
MKQSTLFPQDRIRFLNNALLIDNEILVISDTHIGFEEHIIERGIFPNIQLKDILSDLKDIFEKLKREKIVLKKIIVNGDLKQEFGGISDSEWREVLELLGYLGKHCLEIILIKGNHDNILGPIAKKKKVRLENYYVYKDICFMHGDKKYKEEFKDKNVKIIILGHLHPAITLSDKYKKEKYKCFLVGEWRKKKIIVLPSFSNISFGYDLNSLLDKNDKGFLIITAKNLKTFGVLIYNRKEDKVYDFGVLKRLSKQTAI